MFTVLDETNTAHVTMNNPYTGHSETWDTMNTPNGIIYCVQCFAIQQGIQCRDVELSIVYPEERIQQ